MTPYQMANLKIKTDHFFKIKFSGIKNLGVGTGVTSGDLYMVKSHGSAHHHALGRISATEDHSTLDTRSTWKKFSIWKFPWKYRFG